MKRTLFIKRLLAQASQEVDELYELEKAREERRRKRLEQRLSIIRDLVRKGQKT